MLSCSLFVLWKVCRIVRYGHQSICIYQLSFVPAVSCEALALVYQLQVGLPGDFTVFLRAHEPGILRAYVGGLAVGGRLGSTCTWIARLPCSGGGNCWVQVPYTYTWLFGAAVFTRDSDQHIRQGTW